MGGKQDAFSDFFFAPHVEQKGNGEKEKEMDCDGHGNVLCCTWRFGNLTTGGLENRLDHMSIF